MIENSKNHPEKSQPPFNPLRASKENEKGVHFPPKENTSKTSDIPLTPSSSKSKEVDKLKKEEFTPEPIVLPTELVPIDPDPEAQALRPESERVYKDITVEENNARFWNMLVSTVAESGYEPPVDRQTQVLNIGCYGCREGKVLNSFFGGENFEKLTDRVHVTGIDISGENIELAKDVHRDPKASGEELLPNFTFIEGDATNLADYAEIPPAADIVLLRHNQAIDDRETWTEMFGEALERVTPSGRIIVTSYSEAEHNLALDMFRDLEGEVVVNKENPYAFPLDADLKHDQYIAVFKKEVDESS